MACQGHATVRPRPLVIAAPNFGIKPPSFAGYGGYEEYEPTRGAGVRQTWELDRIRGTWYTKKRRLITRTISVSVSFLGVFCVLVCFFATAAEYSGSSFHFFKLNALRVLCSGFSFLFLFSFYTLFFKMRIPFREFLFSQARF